MKKNNKRYVPSSKSRKAFLPKKFLSKEQYFQVTSCGDIKYVLHIY